MRKSGSLLLLLALCPLLLTGCGQRTQAEPDAFDTLARWVPADATSNGAAFFLDYGLSGEAGRQWARIRAQIEENPSGRQALHDLLRPMHIEEYGLESFIVGPVVSGYWESIEYAVALVNDGAAVEDALRQHCEDVEWEEIKANGTLLNSGRVTDSHGQSVWLTWGIRDNLLFMGTRVQHGLPSADSRTALQALVTLAEADSLGSRPSWQELRDRLPAEPLGLIFVDVAETTPQSRGAPGDTSLGTALALNTEALALAAVPEGEGMRVEIAASFDLQPDAPPELWALLRLPSVDATTWSGLPADTALALVSSDVSAIWPWLNEQFNLESTAGVSQLLGLDLEADLAGANGPLTGEFSLGLTPPLADQPISQGVAAFQMLLLTRDATMAQMAGVQAGMEERGAVFGPQVVEGVGLQTQVGTKLSGYAITYGFEGGTLLLGTSPDIIGQAILAGQNSSGLVEDPVFQAVMRRLPEYPSLVAYLNRDPLQAVARANMTETQYRNLPEWQLPTIFDAIGLGLEFRRDELDGVLYFYLPE